MGIAFCGQNRLQDAIRAFDLASVFTNNDLETNPPLLIKLRTPFCLAYSLLQYGFQGVALFNANQHEDAISRVQDLAGACPHSDTHACRIVKVSTIHSIRKFINFTHQAYLCLELGVNAWDSGRHEEAIDHFTVAVETSAVSSKWAIHTIYEDFVVVR